MQGEENVEASVFHFVRSWMLGHEWSVDTGGEEKEEIYSLLCWTNDDGVLL